MTATPGDDAEVAEEWWRSYRDNPFGRGVQVVVRDESGIIACGRATPKTFLDRGQRLLVAEVGGMYTASEARGRGLFKTVVNTLEDSLREREVCAVYATANDQSGPL